MVSSTLCLHRGARHVSLDELARVPCPPPTETWFPLPHAEVLNTSVTTLERAGFHVIKQSFALSRSDCRFFGTLDLDAPVCEGVCLTVGVRNSTDKSFPIGFCCGERVFVCDNLAFGSEIVIAKKHTRFGKERFNEGIAQAVGSLPQYRAMAAARIDRLCGYPLSDDLANSLLLQAWEEGIVSHRLLPQVIHTYRQPALEEFGARTAWSLFNAFTAVLKARLPQPQVHAALTIKLQSLMDAAATVVTLN